MNIESLSTNISGFLPGYNERTIFLLAILVCFLVMEVFSKWDVKKKSLVMDCICVSFPILILLFLLIVPFIFKTSLAESLSFKYTWVLFIPIILCITVIVLNVIFKNFSTEKYFKSNVKNIINGIARGILILFGLIIFFASLFPRPYAYVLGLNGNNSILEETSQLDIRFSVPVSKDRIKINISPENNDVTLVYSEMLISKDYITGVKIVPKESYVPNSKVVVYITGISNAILPGKTHETSIEFFTPSLPTVTSTSLDNIQGTLAIDTDLTVDLDNQDGNYVYWLVDVTPEVPFTLQRSMDKGFKIDFATLKQDTEYKVSIYEAGRIYNTINGEDVKIGDLNLVKNITFKTTPPPNVKYFNWQSEVLPNSEPLDIEFYDAVDLASAQAHFSISPAVGGSLLLGNTGNTLVFQPDQPFNKATKYTVTFASGMLNKLGGYLEKDVTLEFQTPGIVQVQSIYPRNNATDVDHGTKSVSITFNQPVDHESAQAAFSISPYIAGTFSWKENTMYYVFSRALEYSTQYTIILQAGIKSLYGIDSGSKMSYTFLVEDEVFTLNVPQYYQKEHFSCNLEATRMVLAYRGISATVDGIRNAIGIGQDPDSSWVDGYGTHYGPISSYIRSRGRSTNGKIGWTVQEVLNEVHNGNPVILWLYNNYSQPRGMITLEGGYIGYMGMHSEVVVGYVGKIENPTYIILNDPWRGKQYLTQGALNSVWNYLGYAALAVY